MDNDEEKSKINVLVLRFVRKAFVWKRMAFRRGHSFLSLKG